MRARIDPLRLIEIANLVDSLGVGLLLEEVAEYCAEQAEFAREDRGPRDPEAAAWERWSDLIRQLPGLRLRVDTLPLHRCPDQG